MLDDHGNLLNEWESRDHHSNRCFIRDGIIDANLWKEAPAKVLFLLKEAYDEPGTTQGWDLCELIRDKWKGPKYKMWHTVAYWAYAVHQGAVGRIPRFPNNPKSFSAAQHSLLASAIVNIKKSGGKRASDAADIASYASRDGDLLCRQVALIRPQFVICGYVWPLVRNLWPDAREVYDTVYQVGETLFVDFWHPANQYPNSLNYYALAWLLESAKLCAAGT